MPSQRDFQRWMGRGLMAGRNHQSSILQSSIEVPLRGGEEGVEAMGGGRFVARGNEGLGVHSKAAKDRSISEECWVKWREWFFF